MTTQDIYIKKSLLFAGLIVGSMILESIFPVLSFVKYLIPALFVSASLLSVSSGPIIMVKPIAQNFILIGSMVLFSFLSLFISGEGFYSRFFTEAFLLLAPLLVLLFWNINIDSAKVLNYTIYGAVVAYGIQVIYKLQTQSFISLGEAIRESYMPTETGNIAFIFGLLFLYCYYNNKKKLLLLGLVLFFSFKRINFLAVPATIMCAGYLNNRLTPKQLALLALFANGLLILLLRHFFIGDFDDWIIEHLGIAPNALSMGRQTILATVYEHMKNTHWMGIGLGKAVDLLSSSIQLDGVAMLHSDLLKNYIEFGPIVFCVWVYFFYRINALSKTSIALTLYLNVLFITDNVSVYFFVMTLFYYLICINNNKHYV